MRQTPDTDEIVPPPADTGDRTMQARIAESLFGARMNRLKVAHFEIERRVGKGGMGTVFEATDTRLGRKVALKRVTGEVTEILQNRLLAEAQALAKLSHPNVVQVYEVFEYDDNVYIAMEFVEGCTLSEWQKLERRSWRDVLDIYVQAGRGLAAAHAEGIVHRDFKPKNVLVGKDGRVRVVDFGLAKSIDLNGDSPDTEYSGASDDALRRLVSTNDVTLEYTSRSYSSLSDRPTGITERQAAVGTMTRTGVRLGTPEYMAPEQFEGKHVDSRTDQFGFCVALYEALYEVRPFSAETIAELASAVCNGQPNAPPPGTVVPGWVFSVICHGLARAPGERFESMEAILDALEDDPAPRRRKQWMAAAVVAVAFGGAWGSATGFSHGSRACTGMENQLSGVWDSDRKAKVQEAIMDADSGYSGSTWTIVRERLDGYAAAWIQMKTDTCLATERGEQSAQLLDLRMACLDTRLQTLRAAVDVLSQADTETLVHATEVTSSLPTLDDCADANALLSTDARPANPVVAARVAMLERRIAAAQAHQSMGRYMDGLSIVTNVVAESARIDYKPLGLRARLLQGVLQRDAGKYEVAALTLEQVYSEAIVAGLPDIAAEASALLTYLIGEKLARPQEGRVWAKSAGPLSEVVGTVDARTLYLGNIGEIEYFEGNYQQSREYHERALAIAKDTLGERNTLVASSLHNLGKVAWALGDHVAARSYLEQTLDMTEEQLGPGHPTMAYGAEALGALAYDEGDYETAQAYFEQSLEIYQASLEPQHPDIAYALANLGSIASSNGDFEEAKSNFQQALDLLEARLGIEHPLVAQALLNLGHVATRERDDSIARQYFQRAVTIYSANPGPAHHSVADALTGLGHVCLDVGELQSAREHYSRALQIYEAALGPDHPSVASGLTGLGRTLLEDGDPGHAIAYLERALVLRTLNPVEPVELAETRFALARALWSQTDDERARELAKLSQTTYATSPGYGAELQEVEVWLATRGG